MNQHPRWACLALLLLACLLRFWDLGGQSLWYDEAYTWWVATQVTMEESITSSIHEVIPPGSYLLWRGWVALTGETEFALRSVSALLGVLTVAAAGRVAWWLTQRHAGAVAALALFTIAPPMLWASREVRMYGPVLCFSLLADAALLETLFGPARTRARWAWGWGISALLSLYMLVLAGFWLIGQGVFALIVLLKSALSVQSADQKKRLEIPSSLRALLFPAVAATVLYLPWLLAASRSLGVNRGYWAGYLPPQAFLRTTFQGITVFDFIADEAWAFVISGLILLLAALSLLLTRRKPLAGLYPLCYALPALALLVPLYRTLPKWGLRHSTIFAPAPYLALAVAWGTVGGLPSRRRRLATLALGMSSVLVSGYLLIASANLLEAARLSPVFAHEDWRGVAQYVTENRAPEDLIIIETGSVFPTWVYYAGRDRILPLPDDALLDVTHVLNYENTAPLLNESLQSATGVWLVNWLAEVSDPTDVVATLLSDIGHETPVPTFHNISLRHFMLDQAPDFPPEPLAKARPNTELLPHLWLWGYTLPTTLPADGALHLRTWWATNNPGIHADKFYQASLRLMDASGYTWEKLDEPPGAGDYRPERWPADTLILGYFNMQLPDGIPAGHYTASLILYEAAAPGGKTGEYILGPVRITRPSAPPPVPADMTRVSASQTQIPLNLLATGLDHSTVKPCQNVEGHLFWEVAQPLDTVYTLHLRVGDEHCAQPLTPDFSPEDWQAGDRFLTHFRLPIQCQAPDTEAPLEISLKVRGKDTAMATWIGPDVIIDFARRFAPPGTMMPFSAAFGPDLTTLVGYQVEPGDIAANQPFTLTLYWRAEQVTPTPYSVFVHITPPDAPGPVIAQDDSWPAQGERATFTWIEGEIVTDAHPLPGLPGGRYSIRVGLYGLDGARLPITTGDGPASNDALILPIRLDVQTK